jgi:hypothetical protein
MGFAGDHDLHGHGGVGENSLEAGEIAEDQGCSLIRSEAAGETDGEDGGVEEFTGTLDDRGRGVAGQAAGNGALAYERYHAAFAAAMGFP